MLVWTHKLSLSLSEDVNMIVSKPVWFNRHILIANRSVFHSSFSALGINTVCDLYNANGNMVTFDEMKHRNPSLIALKAKKYLQKICSEVHYFLADFKFFNFVSIVL